jgi:hypothetical protein
MTTYIPWIVRLAVVAVANAAAAVLPSTLGAQTIRVGDNLRVARGLEQRPLVEPHLVVEGKAVERK